MPYGYLGTTESFLAARTSHPSGSEQEQFHALRDSSGKTLVWGPTSNFAHAALVRRGQLLYAFGTTAGRAGGLKLARIYPSSSSAFVEYWNGSTWSTVESDAVFIVAPDVGDLSVQYNETLGRFVLAYLVSNSERIVFRDARSPEGPWSAAKTLVRGGSGHPFGPYTGPNLFSNLYGPYIYPFGSTGDPAALYFNMSQWIRTGDDTCYGSSEYNVKLMRSDLATRTGVGQSFDSGNLLTDGGFDEDLQTCTVAVPEDCPNEFVRDLRTAKPPHYWTVEGQSQTTVGRATLSAPRIAKVQGGNYWQAVSQRVSLKPFTNYSLKIRGGISSTGVHAQFGVRRVVGPAFRDRPTDFYDPWPNQPTACYGLSWTNYTSLADQQITSTSVNGEQTIVFNSDSASLVEVYAGFRSDSGAYATLSVDSIDLRPAQTVADGGFELQEPFAPLSAPFQQEGPGQRYISSDAVAGLSSLANYSWGPNEWNAATQSIAVAKGGYYEASGWFRTVGNFGIGYFGVRRPADESIYTEISFPASSTWTYRHFYFWAPSGTGLEELRLFAGYWSGDGSSGATTARLDVDNLSVERVFGF